MTDRVEQFIRALRQPDLHLVEGVQLETDASFRERILQVCLLQDRLVVEIADARRLDAIGNIYGLLRHGLR